MRLRIDAGQALPPIAAKAPRSCPKLAQLYKAFPWRNTGHIQAAHYRAIRKSIPLYRND